MAFVLADRVEETSATAGTGPLALAGASPGGFRTFGSVMATGDTTRYAYLDAAAGVWEVGLGTFTAGTPPTLSRAPAATSAGGTAPVALPGNPAARVFITPDAAHFAALAPLVNPAFSGYVGVGGTVHFSNDIGRKIDVFDDGTRSYGIGLQPSELAFYAGDNAAHRFRVGTQGPDAPVVATIDADGINATPIGATTPAAGRFTTLVASASLVADGANDLRIVGAAAGAAPAVIAEGADANVNLRLSAKGTGGIDFVAAGGVAYRVQAQVNPVNYVLNEAGATGFAPTFTAAGADAAIGLWFASKGTGSVLFSPGGNVALAVSNPTNPVNTVTVSGAATGSAPTISATGSDANVSLTLSAKGTGTVNVAAFNATGTVTGAGLTTFLASPPAIGGTTANTGRFTTLTATGFLLRSMATGLTASATNTQAGALGLTASINNITTAAANTAVRLPAVTLAANTAAEIIVRNGGANAVNVFPPTNAAINALAANAAFSLAAGASARFQQLSTTLYVTT